MDGSLHLERNIRLNLRRLKLTHLLLIKLCLKITTRKCCVWSVVQSHASLDGQMMGDVMAGRKLSRQEFSSQAHQPTNTTTADLSLHYDTTFSFGAHAAVNIIDEGKASMVWIQ